jgi:hypothetical protein
MNVGSDTHAAIDGSVVYRKSELGAAQLAETQRGPLSPRERQVLILLDGSRTIAELSEFFGAEAAWSLTVGLEAKGFVERADPEPRAEPVKDARRFVGASSVGQASKPARRWYQDWFVLVNLWMLELVLVMVVGLWLLQKRPSATIIPFGATSVQVPRSEGASADGSEDGIEALEAKGAATGSIGRSSQLPSPFTGSKAADGNPATRPAGHSALANGRKGAVSN